MSCLPSPIQGRQQRECLRVMARAVNFRNRSCIRMIDGKINNATLQDTRIVPTMNIGGLTERAKAEFVDGEAVFHKTNLAV